MKRVTASELSKEVYDILIIGGGITGAVALRDAALRGLKVALIEKNDFTLNNDISKEITASGGREISVHGKNASTEIKVLKKLPKTDQTLLSVVPHSGRTNQIRIHLANMGHPIVGDIGYKDPAYFKNNPLTYSDNCLYLHAWKLAFFYKNKKRSFTAKLPAKFSEYGF